MSLDGAVTSSAATLYGYHLLQDIYVLLDDGDRRVLRGFGLSTLQYAAMLLLDGSEGRRLTDMSELLQREKSTLTRIVDRLEQEGLVQRIADPHDRRAQRVLLTPSGAERLAQARLAHRRSLEQRLSVLSTQEQKLLADLLDRLRQGLRAEAEHSNGSRS
jgi:DNA-binding MarR family transcriptional regulator